MSSLSCRESITFQYVALYNPVQVYRHFKGRYCSGLQGSYANPKSNMNMGSWSWVSPKRRRTCTRLKCMMSQETVLMIGSAVRTSRSTLIFVASNSFRDSVFNGQLLLRGLYTKTADRRSLLRNSCSSVPYVNKYIPFGIHMGTLILFPLFYRHK
jgi:hypothetical protein